MNAEQQRAYEWAKNQNYTSVAARYAKLLAGLVDERNKAAKPLRGGRGMSGTRKKYLDFSEVAAGLKAGDSVRSAEFCPNCKTELAAEAKMYDEVKVNYCPECGTKINWED